MIKPLSYEVMHLALSRLDDLIECHVTLIIGGGGAMILAHHFPLATTDIDAVSKGIDMGDLSPFIKQVARELKIPADWLNPYYATFAHTLPSDYGDRLIEVFKGQHITGKSLGREDLLIMKCFAHRSKDIAHARALVKAGANTDFVFDHIEGLQKQNVKGCQEAIDFLDEILDEYEGS
jgi:hypothetical protein